MAKGVHNEFARRYCRGYSCCSYFWELKMNYYSINFPDLAFFLVKTPEDFTVEHVVDQLALAIGVRGLDGTIYNPRNFISVVAISSPDAETKKVARDLEGIFFYG